MNFSYNAFISRIATLRLNVVYSLAGIIPIFIWFQFGLPLLKPKKPDQPEQISAVYYGNLFTDATFNGRTLNTSRAVGSTGGVHEVSLSGGAGYTLPISLPPGTSGMVPTLAVVYNSQVGNGLLGMGWNLAGLSAITRVNQDWIHDQKTSPVALQSTDKLALDGNRLVATNGVYGADNTEYATEIETFSRITSYGTSGAGPMWFKVETKGGIVLEYGNNTESKFTTDNGATILMWRINKMYDSYGNYVEFKYTNTDRDPRIDEILYTGNASAGLSPYIKIKFYYNERTDQNTVYLAGSSVQSKYLLETIQITRLDGSPSLIRQYEFKYGYDNLYSYLSEVIEYGTDGLTRFNSTIFKYGNAPVGLQTSSSSVIAGQATDVISNGDYNGDGFSDLLLGDWTLNTNTGIKEYNQIRVFTKNPTGGFTLGSQINNLLPAWWDIISEFTPPIGFSFNDNDFNGDGKDDLLLTRLTSGSGLLGLAEIKLYYFTNSNASIYSVVNAPIPAGYGIIPANGNYLYWGDFDGDGNSDYILNTSNTGVQSGYKVFFSSPSTGTYNQPIQGVFGTGYTNIITDAEKVLVTDHDGDGKTDLMVVDGSTTTIYTFSKNGAGQHEASTIYNRQYPNIYYPEIYPADFNGDGKTDLFTKNSTGSWNVALAKGNDDWYSTIPFVFSVPTGVTNEKVQVADYNGDGLSDVMHAYPNLGSTPSTASFDIYYSNGKSFDYQHNIYYSYLTYAELALGDFNGDGGVDVINRKYYTEPFDILSFRPFSKNRLLEKVANGLNHVTQFSYERMTAGGVFYSQGTGSAFPLNDVQLPVWLVSSVTLPNGVGGSDVSSYSYEAATLHRQGRGWLGFKKIHSTNSSSGFKTTTEAEINTAHYLLLPKKNTVRLTSNNSLITESSQTIQVASPGTGRIWAKTTQTTATDHLANTTSTTDYTYDVNGNVTQENTNIAGIETYNVQYGPFSSNGSWIPSRPELVSSQRTRTGVVYPAYRTVGYTYNAQGAVTHMRDFYGSAEEVLTQYSNFSSLGLPQTVTVSAPGLAARTSTVTYDNKGRLPLTRTDALGHTETYTYDYRWGKPLTVNTPDGLFIQYGYDPMGRLTTTTTPEAVTITTTTGWDIQPGPGTSTTTADNAVYYVLHQMAGRPDVKTWYDIYGRERKTETEPFSGSQWIKSVTAYDSRGNIRTTTTPFYTGTPIVTTHQYDAYNRLSSISVAGITNPTSYAYSYANGQRIITVTNPAGQVSSQTIDATGKAVSATDHGGTLTYSYDAWGNQTQVAHAGVAVATMAYSFAYGRQTSLTDPNAGTTNYTYNAYGELVSQTDAKGQTHQMQYDLIGRITTRISPEGTTTYEYVTTGNGKGSLKKMIAPNGITREYTYDNLSRVVSDKEVIDGTNYITSYGYNTYGDITTVTYPSSLVINREYNNNGYLTRVRNVANNRTLFDATTGTMDAFGHYTSYGQGNGKTTTKTYNAYGLPTNYAAPGVQNLTLNFNLQTGNLTSRYDQIKGKTETFTYDNLNRLTSAQVSGQAAMTYGYASNGNLNAKTDAGAYTYHTQKIHAVTSVTDAQNVIPSFQQNITYNSFQDPVTITENSYVQTFTYGPDATRKKSELKLNGVTQYTRYYLGSYEKQVSGSTTRHIHYIAGGDGLCAIAVRENNVNTYYHAYTDHLGSILTLTNSSGTPVAEQNFDAWGRARNPSTWTYSAIPSPPAWLYRGYTGHEHLREFGITHMNGRLYDPVLGRMLSPDNYVHTDLGTQGYNRYSYAVNNPMRFTDPGGEIPFVVFAAAAVISGGINMYSNWDAISKSGDWRVGAAYFSSGAIGGAVSVVNPVLGGSITAGGNLITDVATGNLPDLQGLTRGQAAIKVGLYVGGLAMDGFSASGVGQLSRGFYHVWNYTHAPATYRLVLDETISEAGEKIAYYTIEESVELAAVKGVGAVASGSANTTLKSFTRRNLRHNLGQLSGTTPANSQAHHIFPQKFASRFDQLGINIHDPKLAAWWETTSHQANAFSYNQKWGAFLESNRSLDEILAFGRSIASEYGLTIYF